MKLKGKASINSNQIIFDIDGTLANCEHRRHFVEDTPKDFDAFYNAMALDVPNRIIVELHGMYSNLGYTIIICTGRPESYRQITEKWLADNNINYEILLMRHDADRYKPDYIVKQAMLENELVDFDIKIAVDDRDQVVKMWRANNIVCFQVADGNF